MESIITGLAALVFALQAYALELEQKPVELLSTTTVRAYIELRAKEEGLPVELLSTIAACESGYVHDALNKNIRNGVVWSTDRSVFQVNDYYHGRIDDPKENIEYALKLFKKEGTQPWFPSQKCWSKTL